MPAIRRIGILTSGGDCAGLNAVLRAVVLRAARAGNIEVIGIKQGTAGLMTRPVEAMPLNPDMFTGTILRSGGTLLGTTNRGDPFDYPMPDGSRLDRSQEVIEGYRSLELEALIGVGGDGSLALLRRLAQLGGINFIGIPKTIDNDLGNTEVSVGYATALDVATDGLDHLQATAASHSRVMVMEVMGRDAGHIALNAGIAGGADVILVPEIPYTIGHVAAKIEALKSAGRNFALVVVAEAVKTEAGAAITVSHTGSGKTYGGIGYTIAERIAEATGAETRVTVLGHLQRGGTPNARDRIMASVFGVHAVELILSGTYDRMVAWSGRHVIDVPLADAVADFRDIEPDGPMVRTARGLGICLGDA